MTWQIFGQGGGHLGKSASRRLLQDLTVVGNVSITAGPAASQVALYLSGTNPSFPWHANPFAWHLACSKLACLHTIHNDWGRYASDARNTGRW